METKGVGREQRGNKTGKRIKRSRDEISRGKGLERKRMVTGRVADVKGRIFRSKREKKNRVKEWNRKEDDGWFL